MSVIWWCRYSWLFNGMADELLFVYIDFIDARADNSIPI